MRILIKVLEIEFYLLYSIYGGKSSLGLVNDFEGLFSLPKLEKSLSQHVEFGFI